MDKTCTTCYWYAHSAGVCMNWDSGHMADFREAGDSCPCWGNCDYSIWGEEDTK